MHHIKYWRKQNMLFPHEEENILFHSWFKLVYSYHTMANESMCVLICIGIPLACSLKYFIGAITTFFFHLPIISLQRYMFVCWSVWVRSISLNLWTGTNYPISKLNFWWFRPLQKLHHWIRNYTDHAKFQGFFPGFLILTLDWINLQIFANGLLV